MRAHLGRVGAHAVLAALALILMQAVPGAIGQSGCHFQQGFKLLRDLIPDVVGECLEDEQHNPENGDGLQRTANGLLVWRKADNWTAFTDGATTWINGPEGLQARPIGERFAWEAGAQRSESGIEGLVTLSPTCPGPQRAGQVCEQPYQATISVLDQRGNVVTRIRSGADGRFRVVLAPGSYTLRPESPGALPRAGELAVTVTAGQFTRVDIRYDSGMR
jgi:hypothetical protein